MKKIILSAIAALTISANAQAFVPLVQTFVNRDLAIVRVWNTTARPIVCSGVVYGRTQKGVTLNTWVNQKVISQNTFVEVYVRSNYYDPMVQAWAQLNCEYYLGL